MKVLIEIDEDVYKKIVADKYAIYDKMFYSIKNGTPLPKGYGRLVDADAYAKKYDTHINGRIGGEYLFAPTIIEADKEQTDENNN